MENNIEFKHETHGDFGFDEMRSTMVERIGVVEHKVRMLDRSLATFVEACPEYVTAKAEWDRRMVKVEKFMEFVRGIAKSVREITRRKPDYFDRFYPSEKSLSESEPFQMLEVFRKNADIIQAGGLLVIGLEILDDLESGMETLQKYIHLFIEDVGKDRWSLDKELEYLQGLITEELTKWEKRLEKRYSGV